MHNQMLMMEAHGRHEDFVTSASNLKHDEQLELQKFKDQNRRQRNGQNSKGHGDSSTSQYDSYGVSNVPTQIQSKVSSTIGAKLESKRGKKNDRLAHVNPPTI